MLDFTRFRALTFDCYGTLIDWETGLVRALRVAGIVRDGNEEAVLEAFAVAEAAAESPGHGYVSYADVLREVLGELRRQFGGVPVEVDARALSRSIRDWPAFDDTVTALRALKKRFRLAVVSNIDRDLFAGSLPRLGVELDALITAEDVRSYKPGDAHFRRALEVLALPAASVLHVAQSLYHDIKPARELGLSTVWVNRRSGKAGGGATAPAAATPDLVVSSLQELVERVESGNAGDSGGRRLP